MKVAIVHDDLVQWGGAEKVLWGISELFPNAPIYTSVFDRANQKLINFREKDIRTSFLQKIPGWRFIYKALLPLYPVAFEQFDFSDYDLVISQTTRFARAIITKPETKHVCYCHTPPRFLWNFSGQNTSPLLRPYLSFLKHYDKISSNRVDRWIAGSKNAQSRIKEVYGFPSDVCQPYVDIKKSNLDPFEGDYYLIIARLNKYKRIDLAVKLFNQLGIRLRVVGIGPELARLSEQAGENIEFLGLVSDELLADLISGCKALIITAEEDFGLTALEAQTFGKPVIAFGKGGAIETIVENKTGVYFNKQSVDALKKAVEKLDNMKIDQKDCIENAQKFSKDSFQKRFLKLVFER